MHRTESLLFHQKKKQEIDPDATTLQRISLLGYMGVVLLTLFTLFRDFFLSWFAVESFTGMLVFLMVLSFAVLNALNLRELLRVFDIQREGGVDTVFITVLLLITFFFIFSFIGIFVPILAQAPPYVPLLFAYTSSFIVLTAYLKQHISLSMWNTALLGSSWYVFSLLLLAAMYFFFFSAVLAG